MKHLVAIWVMHLLIWSPLQSTAQQPPAQPVHTLEQMEAIYQRELSTRHIPLITRHLLEVQRLAATAADRQPYDLEIAQLQNLLKTGVIDLKTAREGSTALSTMPMPAPAVASAAEKAVITLFPALAEKASSTDTTVRLGLVEWRLQNIAAGDYDILLEYAATAAALEEPLPLTVELGGQKIDLKLTSSRSTPDESTFRILRLGRLSLPMALRSEKLSLSAGLRNSPPRLLLRHLFILPAPKAAPAP